MDADPGGPITRGSGGSGFGSATLVPVVVVEVQGAGLSLVLQVEQVDKLQLLLLDEKIDAVFDLTGHYYGGGGLGLLNMIHHHVMYAFLLNTTDKSFSSGVKPLSYF
jgi:hypothetical protein